MNSLRHSAALTTLTGRLAVRLLNALAQWDESSENPALTGRMKACAAAVYSRLRRPRWSQGRAPWNRVKLSAAAPHAYYQARIGLALDSMRMLRGSRKIDILPEPWPSLPWGRKPVLLLGIHYGNFEAILRHLGTSPPLPLWRGGLFAPTFSRPLFAWLGRQREAMGLKVLAPGNAAALRTWIRAAGVLGTLADQGREPFRWEPAVGITAPWPETLVHFARHHGAWVLAASAVREEANSRTKIRFGPAWDLGSVREETFKAEFSRWSNKTIAENPLLFDWSYPRLRIETEGDPTLTA